MYAPLDFGAARFCELRVWSMFNRVSDEMDKYREYATGENLEAERMPLFIKPNRKLTPQDLMNFKRDHLEGTELENKFTEYTPGVDAAALELWKTEPELAREFLTDYSCNMGEYTIKRWKELGEFLLVKYLDGNRKKEEKGRFLRNEWGYPQPPAFPGYSDKWKKRVIKDTGDRFVYPEQK